MIPTTIGIVGMFLLIVAFFMNQTHRWKDDDLIYDAANFVGAFILVVYAWLILSWPFLILNCVWAAVSLRDIYIALKKGKKRSKGRIGHKRR